MLFARLCVSGLLRCTVATVLKYTNHEFPTISPLAHCPRRSNEFSICDSIDFSPYLSTLSSRNLPITTYSPPDNSSQPWVNHVRRSLTARRSECCKHLTSLSFHRNVASQFMEDMEKRSNCALTLPSLFCGALHSSYDLRPLLAASQPE